MDAYGHYDAAEFNLDRTDQENPGRATNQIDRATYRLLRDTGHEVPDGDLNDNALDQAVEKALKAYGQMRHDRDRLAAQVAAAYAFADEMAGYCSPHGVAHTYAQRLREALDRAAATPAD